LLRNDCAPDAVLDDVLDGQASGFERGSHAIDRFVEEAAGDSVPTA